MVDTPRTLAELKAIFANNTTGDITPQDMRDMLESVIDPVPAGGMEIGGSIEDTVFYAARQDTPHLTGCYDAYNVADVSADIPASTGVGCAPRLVAQAGDNASALWDPQGWIVPGSFVGGFYGITHPPGSVVMLPRGVYQLSTGFVLSGTNDADTRVWPGVDYADDPYGGSFGPATEVGLLNYNQPFLRTSIGGDSLYSLQTIAVPEPIAVFPYVDVRNHPSAFTLSYFNLMILKIR